MRIDLEQISRFAGAGIAGGLAAVGFLYVYEPCERNWLAFATPFLIAPAVAAAFSFPRIGLAAYARNGSAAVLGVAVAAGLQGPRIELTGCELLLGGFLGWFIMLGSEALVGLVLLVGIVLLLGWVLRRLCT